MILKSYIVEQNLNILEGYNAVLLHGENDGIKDDIKNKLKILNKKSEILNFFEGDIVKNKSILYESFINESLFNEKKIIFIQMGSDKIYDEVCDCIKKNKSNVKIYIFSDPLDKKSKLRNFFEKDNRLGIFACYEDNERTLINYISNQLVGYKGITGELINIIIKNSSYKRKIIQSELIKIKNYFFDKTINKNELLEILNIKNDTEFNDLRDSALIGEKIKINKLLSEIDLLNEDTFFYLNNLNYRVLKLIEILKANMVFNDFGKTLDTIKPPIFWKDKPIFILQLKKWNLKKLNKIAYKIGETEILMKKNSQIRNDIIIKDLIIKVSNEAANPF